jgi:cytochrome c-type biogenesis protein CcmH/NrfF
LTDRPVRRRASAATLALVAAVLVAAAALAFVAFRGAPGPRSFQDQVRAVAATLQCPACLDLSVADSPSAVAGEIRADIARRLRGGQSPAEIRRIYVERYGPRILLSPPTTGVTLFAWLFPILLLVAGSALAVAAILRWRANGSDLSDAPAPGERDAGPLLPSDRQLLDRAAASFAAGEDTP